MNTDERKQSDVMDGNHIERAETAQTHDGDGGKYPRMDKVDEFGAHAKTDPKEITLVKKLDRYIIVFVHTPLFKTTTDHIAYALVHVPLQLPRSKRPRQRSS